MAIFCPQNRAADRADGIGVAAKVAGPGNARAEIAVDQLEHAKGLGYRLANGSLVAGPQLVVQGHPGQERVAARLVHNVHGALHRIGIPGVLRDGTHGGLQNFLNASVGHGRGHGGGY